MPSPAPLRPDDPRGLPPRPERPASAGLVLIVDDVPDNLALLHDALDAAGYTVLVATDGASALQRAAQAEPDIVLLDAVMPGLDGFEVARRLKAGPETAHIPIVFMTGLTETDHVISAFGAGVSRLTTTITMKPSGPPNTPAEIGWIPHQMWSATGEVTPKTPRNHGWVVAM